MDAVDRAMGALLALTGHGVPSDVQELLVKGSPALGVRPGALQAALHAAGAREDPVDLCDAQVKHMAERFLRWPLPENFDPDGGIRFEPVFNAGTPHEGRHKPSGTNLLDWTQAVAMVRYLIEGMPR